VSAGLEHLTGTLSLALVVVAPLPVGWWLVAQQQRESRSTSVPQALLIVLASWCVAQALLAHALALVHGIGFAGVVAAEIALLGGGCALLASVPRPLLGWPRFSLPEKATLLALALLGVTLLWWSAAMPVVDYDSWAFHMPHMADWLQSGTFTRIAQGAERPRNSYPYGWEALCTLFLLPLREDVLVTLPNLVAWAMLGVGVHLLARTWRARRTDALACAALLLSLPGIAGPLNSLHVDLAFAALFVAAAWLGALWVREGGQVALGLGAAVLGLAAAVRVSAPAYVGFLALWLWLQRLQRGRRRESPGAAGIALAGIATGLALGGFWYAKNWLELGHPLGAGAPFAGAVSAEGSWSYFASQTLLFTVAPLQPSSWRVLLERASGELGLPFVALAGMAALWPLSRIAAGIAGRGVLRDSSGDENSAPWLPAALLLVGTLVLFWVTPLSANSGIQIRLGFPFLAALAVVAALGATRARLPVLVPVLLAVAAAVTMALASRVALLAAPALVLGGAVWAWLDRGRPSTAGGREDRRRADDRAAQTRALDAAVRRGAGARRRAAGLLAGAVALSLLAAFLFVARERRERERRSVYGPFWDYLEQQVDARAPLAYLLSTRSYLFYGRRVARTVVYAPLAPGESEAEWAARLRRRGIEIVALGPWQGEDAQQRAVIDRLTGADGPLTLAAGRGLPGEVSLYRLQTTAGTE